MEGLKRNIAMNACAATQASFACGVCVCVCVWGGVSHGPGGWVKDGLYSDQAGCVIHLSPWSENGTLLL